MKNESHNRRSPQIRDIQKNDLARVLEINQQSVPGMNSLKMDDMEWFAEVAEYFRVAEIDGEIAGFLICLLPETDYHSYNLRWLNERYKDFFYVDRIAVASEFKRCGVAGSLYRDAASRVPAGCEMLVCEVNVRPRNDDSLAFHDAFGFEAVGTEDYGSVCVQYMIRSLPL